MDGIKGDLIQAIQSAHPEDAVLIHVHIFDHIGGEAVVGGDLQDVFSFPAYHAPAFGAEDEAAGREFVDVFYAVVESRVGDAGGNEAAVFELEEAAGVADPYFFISGSVKGEGAFTEVIVPCIIFYRIIYGIDNTKTSAIAPQ